MGDILKIHLLKIRAFHIHLLSPAGMNLGSNELESYDGKAPRLQEFRFKQFCNQTYLRNSK